MPKLSNFDKTLKNVNKVANHASAISAVAGLVSGAAMFIMEMASKRERRIDISAICNKTGHPMTLDEAREYLEKAEIKAIYIPIKVSEADIRYRDCFESQVVDVKPSVKIAQDDIPQVYYVTRVVIDESQHMYELSEKQKAEVQATKIAKQTERKEKTQQMMTGAVKTAKQIFKKKNSDISITDADESPEE